MYNGQLLIGNYNTDLYGKKGEEIVWANMANNTHYWTMDMATIKLGNDQLKTSGNKLVFDSGMSYAIIPQYDFDAVLDFFNELNIPCIDQSWGVYSCKISKEQYENLPDLKIQVYLDKENN